MDSADDGLKRSKLIRHALQQLSEEALQRHAVLKYQEAIGLGILLGSLAAIAACVWAYAAGHLPAWMTVVTIAFFLSLLHELEHDLIHRLYFKTQPWLYNGAMLAVWLVRPSTINPWVRRDWHLHHHRASGTASDLEERGLTNGERWGLRRLLMSLDPLLALVLRPLTINNMLQSYATAHRLDRAGRIRSIVRNVLAYFPFGPLYAGALWWVCGLHLAVGFGWQPGPINQAAQPMLDFVAVTVLLPNALRTACLYFVSSNIHYYGDIEPKNIVQQTQVWTAPWLWPFQAFCFNFGSTHAIHHFAVQHPFYLRQLIVADAHRVMREHGVRFNDFSTMLRANRWHSGAVAPITPSADLDRETGWSQAASASV
jgi:hypothetical protein